MVYVRCYCVINNGMDLIASTRFISSVSRHDHHLAVLIDRKGFGRNTGGVILVDLERMRRLSADIRIETIRGWPQRDMALSAARCPSRRDGVFVRE
jgi:hypothetical protein